MRFHLPLFRRFPLFLLPLIVLVLATAAQAEPLKPRAFAQEMVRTLTALLPSAKVELKTNRELMVTSADGRQFVVFLDNAYREYARDPSRLAAITRFYAADIAKRTSEPEAAGTTGKVDRTRIVPVIKDKQWLADTYAALKVRGAKKAPDFVVEPFNDELIVIYAEDNPKSTRYLTAPEIDVDRKDLRALAIDNLMRIVPKIEMRNHDDVFTHVAAGGDYEASLLLLDHLWSGGQIKVKGDIVVAIPARDVLLITGSRHPKGLEVVRGIAADLATKGPHRLISTLFVYRNGRFEKFEGK